MAGRTSDRVGVPMNADTALAEALVTCADEPAAIIAALAERGYVILPKAALDLRAATDLLTFTAGAANPRRTRSSITWSPPPTPADADTEG